MIEDPMERPPKINGVLETALYVADMTRSIDFFRDVIGLDTMLETDRLTAFDVGGQGALLIFLSGASREDMDSDRGTIPGLRPNY